MKHVSVLVLDNAVMAGIVDALAMFNGVNHLLDVNGKPPFFNCQLVGLNHSVSLLQGKCSVHADVLINDLPQTQLIIIPPIGRDFRDTVEKNRDFIPWIQQQYEQGAEVASLCSGVFVLAATGLLNGKECSSHWNDAQLFRDMYPHVNLVDGRIVTEQNGLYSSGGATSYWNLMLHLVEKYTGREMAILISKHYALEIDRKSQSPFSMFNGQKKHKDEPIKQAQEFIEQHIGERISVEDLSIKFAIGKRHFERRFKKATNNTPIEYIQRVKIEAAKKKLESSDMNVNEVMYEVGYENMKSFRSVFKKLTGLSPIDYRNKYNKEAAVHQD
jgi:Transcriptional regulator containing an amidase domain and an AraC-type DNA-binding HTH domain